MLIAVPLGVGLAIGLTRWRGYGARPVNYLMLFPLVTPEIVMAVSLLLVFSLLYSVPFGTQAQTLGQVTFSISYVVIIVRGRLLSIGPEYEEAARDLGASPLGAFRLVLLPLLWPAIFAGFIVVFALSIDDFVVTQYMSSDQSTATVPMLLYQGARGTVPARVRMNGQGAPAGAAGREALGRAVRVERPEGADPFVGLDHQHPPEAGVRVQVQQASQVGREDLGRDQGSNNRPRVRPIRDVAERHPSTLDFLRDAG